MRVDRGLQLQRVRFLDQRTHPVGLRAAGAGVAHALDHLFAPRRGNELGQHRRAARRQFVDDRHVEVGVVAHGQRARDGRGAHHQLVRAEGARLGAQRQALAHAEAVLFVDHCGTEAREIDRVLDQRMRADRDRRLAAGNGRLHGALVAHLQAARQPGHADAQRFEPAGQLAVMLFGEDFGRRHERRLIAGLDRAQAGERRDHGLAGADVALQQALHRERLREIGGYLRPGACLRSGQAERQCGHEALEISAPASQ
jgi:hypothetical protein